MPSQFPHPIKDLIRQMLKKGPRSRMTNAQLKKHPGLQLDIRSAACRMNSPVLIPPTRHPIDPDRIDAAIVADLVQLGFETGEQVRDQLLEVGDNDAKVFYHMMTIRIMGLRDYPWSSINDMPESPPQFFEFPGPGVIGHETWEPV
jgi:serine/threonine protein kinase